MLAGRNIRGFSLIELAVVLAIIGVMAALAGPNMLGLRGTMRNKGAAADISGMLRAGRSAAMQENVPYAVVVRTGVSSDQSDDRAVLLRCPVGTSASYDFSSITVAMMDGSAALPAGFTLVRKAEFGTDSGIGPGSNGVLNFYGVYSGVPRSTGCSFCSGGVGAVVFKSDGKLAFSPPALPTPQKSGSITVSLAAKWPSPADVDMYSISIMTYTGEIRVWH